MVCNQNEYNRYVEQYDIDEEHAHLEVAALPLNRTCDKPERCIDHKGGNY